MLNHLEAEIKDECCACGVKTPPTELYKTSCCDCFVCSGCATYHKKPWTLGYVCEKCYSEQRSSNKRYAA